MYIYTYAYKYIHSYTVVRWWCVLRYVLQCVWQCVLQCVLQRAARSSSTSTGIWRFDLVLFCFVLFCFANDTSYIWHRSLFIYDTGLFLHDIHVSFQIWYRSLFTWHTRLFSYMIQVSFYMTYTSLLNVMWVNIYVCSLQMALYTNDIGLF